jgi:hypothetical protein
MHSRTQEETLKTGNCNVQPLEVILLNSLHIDMLMQISFTNHQQQPVVHAASASQQNILHANSMLSGTFIASPHEVLHSDVGANAHVCLFHVYVSSSPEGCDGDDSDLELELQQLQQGTVSTSNSGGVLAAANRASGTCNNIQHLLKVGCITSYIC